MEQGTNPIKKVPLVITGSDGNLIIDEYEMDDANLERALPFDNDRGFMVTQVRIILLKYVFSNF